MRRKGQIPAEVYLPSTTRAVAWGALFFSVLACLVSVVTLFLTWHDGRLVRNFNLLSEGIRENMTALRAERGAKNPPLVEAEDSPARTRRDSAKRDGSDTPVKQGATDAFNEGGGFDETVASEMTDMPAPAEIETNAMRDRLGRIEEMIKDGNTQARYQLDKMMDELRPMRDQVSKRGAAWVEKTLQTLNSARDQLSENGPAAAEKLRALAAGLRRGEGARSSIPEADIQAETIPERAGEAGDATELPPADGRTEEEP